MDMLSSNDAIFTTQTTCLCDEHLQIDYFLGILEECNLTSFYQWLENRWAHSPDFTAMFAPGKEVPTGLHLLIFCIVVQLMDVMDLITTILSTLFTVTIVSSQSLKINSSWQCIIN